MEEVFYSLAVLCVLYYGILVIYTRSVISTFSWFWISSAAVFCLLGMITSFLPNWGKSLVDVLFIGCMMFFFATEIVIFGGMFLPRPPKSNKKKMKTKIKAQVETALKTTLQIKVDRNLIEPVPEKKQEKQEEEHLYSVLIVPGAHINKTEPCDTLKRRLEKAIDLLIDDPELKVIVSGGCGKGEIISEAESMKRYLRAYGIREDRVIMEDQSRSTRENLENCLQYIEDPKENIGIVTNNFHMYRTLKQAKICGYESPKPVVVTTDYIMFLNYVVREFFSVINMYLTVERMEREEKRQEEAYKKQLEEHPLEAYKHILGEDLPKSYQQKEEENPVEVDKQKTEVL